MLEISHFGEVIQIKMGREIGGRVLYWVAAYLVDGLLIDTGCNYTSEEFAGFLEGRNIGFIVNTHHHEDHIGANRHIRSRFGVKAFAHPEAIPLIGQVLELLPYQVMVWGYPEPSQAEPLSGGIDTDKYSFEIIETPGHCRGHIALLEKRTGWCFPGDLFVSENQKVLRADEDIDGIYRSVKKLFEVNTDKLVLFTSIGRVVENGRDALGDYAGYLEDLATKARRLEKEGLTAEDIRDEIFGRESSMSQPTGGHYSSANLIRSILQSGI